MKNMAEDFYSALGVSKDASQDEIQKAYLKLARKYHPDMNPDDPEGAKKKFQEIQAAFDVLKDPEKRKMYDLTGSADGQGFSGGNPFGAGGNPFGGGNFHWAGGGPHGAAGGAGGINIDDILGGMFGAGGANPFGGAASGGRTRRRRQGPIKGENSTSSVTVPFQTAVKGDKIALNLRRGNGRIESVDVSIPAGIEAGKKIRLRGMGEPSPNGGESGDLIIEVDIAEHPFYKRKGQNLYVTVPITLKEAALGGKVDVPTPDGTLTVTVPAGSTSGTKLRLKGRGIESAQKNEPAGDLYVEFEVQLPKSWSKKDQELLNQLDTNTTPPIRSGLYF